MVEEAAGPEVDGLAAVEAALERAAAPLRDARQRNPLERRRAASGAAVREVERAARALVRLPVSPRWSHAAAKATRLLLDAGRTAPARTLLAAARRGSRGGAGLPPGLTLAWADALVPRGRWREARALLGAALPAAVRAAGADREEAFRVAASCGAWEPAARLGGELSRAGVDPARGRALAWPFPGSLYDLQRAAGGYRRALLASARSFARVRDPWAAYYLDALGGPPMPAAWEARLAGGPLAWMLDRPGQRALAERRLLPAARAFLAATDARGGDWLLRLRGAEALLCAGRRAESRVQARRALAEARAAGHEADALTWTAMFALWTGDARAALDTARRAGRAGAYYAGAVEGGALVLLGLWKSALGPLERRIAAGYHATEAHVWKAEALWRLGRHASAAAAARAARRTGGGPNFYALVIEGLAREAGGERGAAARALAGLPAPIRAWAARLSGTAARRLQRLLAASRGVRREGHELCLWLPSFARDGRPARAKA